VILKDLLFTENKKIIIQEYTLSKLEFQPSDIQLTIREWDPSVWKVHSPYEILFHKGTTFLEFAQKIQSLYPHINVLITLFIL
jgi:hypothetical protein